MFFFVLMTDQLLKHDFGSPLQAELQVLIMCLNLTFIHYVQRLANVTKIAKLILRSIFVL